MWSTPDLGFPLRRATLYDTLGDPHPTAGQLTLAESW